MARTLRPKRMTIDEFLAFTDTRPDDERWELIDGVPVLNPSPTDFHQLIVANVLAALVTLRRARKARWIALPGIGTKAADFTDRLPQPDVLIKAEPATGSRVSGEALVIFEVLSRSNTRKDQSWRLSTYQNVQGAEHYVVVHQNQLAVVRYDRASGWQPFLYRDLSQALELPALSVEIPLREIYDCTPFGESGR
jgi:Uma2 family endonuclease